MVTVIIIYTFLCFLVAAKGASWKDLNFWFVFFISFVGTPFAGWIYVQGAKTNTKVNNEADGFW